MPGCQATPHPGHGHAGTVRAYVRICPQAHYRAGYVCDGCASNGAILCNDCPSDAPAILIRRDCWDALITEPGPALRLIETALALRAEYGETPDARAAETWADWDRQAEELLRAAQEPPSVAPG